MIEYAKIAGDKKLLNKIKEYSVKNFFVDTNCPTNYEPSGTDFISSCLAEAGLMAMVLDDIQFNKWLYNFSPTFEKTKFNNIINPLR